MHRGAEISRCGMYRYQLWREWDADLPYMVFIMLNPSTADAVEDDPTIRRCIGFAQREGCGGIEVVNLFAFRATSPADMKACDDPIGPENDDWILQSATHAENAHVVGAWGAHGTFKGRDVAVRKLLVDNDVKLKHLGLTKQNQPKHPLYLRTDTQLEAFDG